MTASDRSFAKGFAWGAFLATTLCALTMLALGWVFAWGVTP